MQKKINNTKNELAITQVIKLQVLLTYVHVTVHNYGT